MYMEYYHFLRSDANRERIEAIQFAHIRELCQARKARLCDLLGLPAETNESHYP